MTIKECIDIVDNAKPNQYSIKEKVMWLSFVDETIINDVLKTHEGYDGRYDDFTGYTEDKLSVPLIVPSPYDRLYPQYIKMMIDSENGETARYNNSAALYNTYLNEYKKYYNKTHMPLNATQKNIPSPVSININSHLSDAQIEYIKRQLYYMLSQDVGEVISHDKLYDIAMEYYQNNTEVLKGKDGKDGEDGEKGEKGDKGDKGKDGTLWTPLYFEVDIKKGENKKAKFDFNRNILYFGYEEYGGLNKDDYPNVYEWTVGDFFVSNDGKILQIKQLEWTNSEFLNVDVTCISEHNLIVDQVFDWNSENALSGKALAGVLDTLLKEVAMVDLSNVTNADFKAKAEAAGVGGDAGLAGEGCVMKFMNEVSALPETANDGEVYSLSPWTNVGEFFDASGTVITEHTIFFGGWSSIANFLYDDVQRYSGCTYKFIIGNREFIFKECYVSSAGPDGFEMSVNCTEQDVNYTIPYDSTVEVYRTDGEPKDNDSYVRFNGKWIKL